MKTCPFCGAENQDNASACYFCGNNLNAWTQAPATPSQTEPTQPVRTRLYTPQPGAYPDPGTQPTQAPYPDPGTGTQPLPRYAPPPGGGVASTSPSPYSPAYTPPPPYIPPPPPAPGPLPKRGLGSVGMVLLFALGAVLIFVCGLAVWTLTTATNTGLERLRAQAATQSADLFAPFSGSPGSKEAPGASGTGQLPGEVGLASSPTPWPTFTPQPQPTDTPAPAPTQAPPPADTASTPNPTQAITAEKLLSTGCRTALDTLGKLSDQAASQPTVAFDATWRKDITQAMADMKTNCGTLDAASPVPGLLNQAHQDLARAQAEFDQSTTLFNEGVTNLDPAKFLEAAQHIQQAAKYLNQGIAELKKIGQ